MGGRISPGLDSNGVLQSIKIVIAAFVAYDAIRDDYCVSFRFSTMRLLPSVVLCMLFSLSGRIFCRIVDAPPNRFSYIKRSCCLTLTPSIRLTFSVGYLSRNAVLPKTSVFGLTSFQNSVL